MKNNNLQKFGQKLKELRINKGLTLRKMCKKVGYDPSNWSKIERGRIPPPSNEKILNKWAEALGLINSIEIKKFISDAQIAQGLIPSDIMKEEDITEYLPAFFRSIKKEKMTKKDIEELIKLIRKS
ncbi:MAG: transcriptional regulator [Patescibacteria group bacterium]|jgi:transcriptional regulator with XRE-family HTH domain|nr:transcriptional regulator [Patescibacteria group bacterium]MDD5172629.1 transcriptional regulator [Patescibacteria group bacterium]